MAGHPGAAAHLPAALHGPGLSCTWQLPTDVTLEMRTRIVEWLMLAADFLQLDPEWRVLHRTVLLLDCCMQRAPVRRDQLQLLAVAALRLACKYEGLQARVTAKMTADITNGACTVEDIARIEWHAFKALRFQVGMATTWEWAKALAQRRKRRMTDTEWYRLDYSLLQNSPLARHVAAERVLGTSVLVSHPLLKKRYPDLVLAPPCSRVVV